MITFTRLFPLWTISGVLLAILGPDWLVPLQAAIVVIISIIVALNQATQGRTTAWMQEIEHQE